jgi:hypothetical protein
VILTSSASLLATIHRNAFKSKKGTLSKLDESRREVFLFDFVYVYITRGLHTNDDIMKGWGSLIEFVKQSLYSYQVAGFLSSLK